MEDITFYIVAMHELIYVFSFTLGTYVILCSYSIYNVQETFIEKNLYLPILLAWSIYTQHMQN
jgi:hypothetical protein